jgi:hypothetical protein
LTLFNPHVSTLAQQVANPAHRGRAVMQRDMEPNAPALMRLAATMRDDAGLRLEPFGALDAVIAAEIGKILYRFGVFELGKVLRREQIGLYLIDVSAIRRQFFFPSP